MERKEDRFRWLSRSFTALERNIAHPVLATGFALGLMIGLATCLVLVQFESSTVHSLSRIGMLECSVALFLASCCVLFVAKRTTTSGKQAAIRQEVAKKVVELSNANQPLLKQASTCELPERNSFEARDLVEAELRRKSDFVATISHEIRTPLNGILGVLELLSLTTLDAEQRQLVDSAATSGRMLKGFLADILDFSRLESHHLQLHTSRFFPRRLTRDVCQLLAREAAGRGISLEYHVGPQVPHSLLGDTLRIQQVLVNLTANALKFTRQGFVKLNLDAAMLGDRCALRIAVQDSGVGIPPQQLERIFEPFHQVDNPARCASNHNGGVGLGLAIARRLVDAMRGEIVVESEPGIGTTFTVILPLEVPDAVLGGTSSLENLSAHVASPPSGDFADFSPISTQSRSSEISFSTADSLRLPPLTALVADDNPVNRIVLDRQLQKLGCNVLTCENGDEALELWASQRPDLLFTDLYMPGLSGMDLVKAIREKESEPAVPASTPRLVAFLVSAAQSPALSAEAKKVGFDGTISKPFSFVELVRLVNRVRKADRSTTPDPCTLVA